MREAAYSSLPLLLFRAQIHFHHDIPDCSRCQIWNDSFRYLIRSVTATLDTYAGTKGLHDVKDKVYTRDIFKRD